MAKINEAVFKNGLSEFDPGGSDTIRVHLLSQAIGDLTTANDTDNFGYMTNSSYSLTSGETTSLEPSSVSYAASGDGFKVTVSAISAGGVTTEGTVLAYAIVNVTNSKVLAVGDVCTTNCLRLTPSLSVLSTSTCHLPLVTPLIISFLFCCI